MSSKLISFAKFIVVVIAAICIAAISSGCSDPHATKTPELQATTQAAEPSPVVIIEAEPSEYELVLNTKRWVFEEIQLDVVTEPECNNFQYAEVTFYAYAKDDYARKVCFEQKTRDYDNYRAIAAIKRGAQFDFCLRNELAKGAVTENGRIEHNGLVMYRFGTRILFRLNNLTSTQKGVSENLSRGGVQQR